MKTAIVLVALAGLLIVEARVVPREASYVYMQHPYMMMRPHQAMLVSGYYGAPESQAGYQPEAAMSTFASGGAVSTGTSYGPPPPPSQSPCGLCQEVAEQQGAGNGEGAGAEQGWENGVESLQAGTNRPFGPEEPAPTAVQPAGHYPAPESGTEVYHKQPELVPQHPKGPKAPRKDKKQKKPAVLTEDEDEEDNEEGGGWMSPVANPARRQNGGGGGGYYQFFPMNFGGKGFGGPGTATAVANSFSTGKGGSATSTATAYGSFPPQQHGHWKRANH